MVELNPVSWTPHGRGGGEEHPRCRRAIGRTRRSSGNGSRRESPQGVQRAAADYCVRPTEITTVRTPQAAHSASRRLTILTWRIRSSSVSSCPADGISAFDATQDRHSGRSRIKSVIAVTRSDIGTSLFRPAGRCGSFRHTGITRRRCPDRNSFQTPFAAIPGLQARRAAPYQNASGHTTRWPLDAAAPGTQRVTRLRTSQVSGLSPSQRQRTT